MNFFHNFLVRRYQEQFSSVNLVFTSEICKESLTSHNHVLYKTWKLLISRGCFAEDGGESDQTVFCTCNFTVFFINDIVCGVLHGVAVVVLLRSLFSRSTVIV